jgi:hypothetical protein
MAATGKPPREGEISSFPPESVSAEGEEGEKKCTVSTLAIAPLLRRRSSGRVSAGAGSAGISDVARLETHMQEALRNTSSDGSQVKSGSMARRGGGAF